MKRKISRRQFAAASASLASGLTILPGKKSWSAAKTTDALDKKIGRLFTLNMFWKYPPDFFLSLMENYQVGGAYIDRNALSDFATAEKAIKRIVSAASDPVIIITDCEGGKVNRARKVVPFESARELGARFISGELDGPGFFSAFSKKLEPLSGLGFNFNFDPVLDLDGPYIGSRSYGKDPEKVADMAVKMVAAYRDLGMHGVIKHFPGMGTVRQDPHADFFPSIDPPLEVLMERELVPFKAAMEKGASSVLVGHCKMSCIDDSLPASLSPSVMSFIRKDLAFKGLIWPDSLTMGAVYKYQKSRGVPSDRLIRQSCVDALKAGVDQIFNFRLNPADFPLVVRAVREAVISKEIPESRIDEAQARSRSLF